MICTGRACVREHSQVPNSLLRSHFWPALLCAAHSVVLCNHGLVLQEEAYEAAAAENSVV